MGELEKKLGKLLTFPVWLALPLGFKPKSLNWLLLLLLLVIFHEVSKEEKDRNIKEALLPS